MSNNHNRTTTISITLTTRNLLQSLKKHHRETYEEVIVRLAGEQ